jgi:hypothetical protein
MQGDLQDILTPPDDHQTLPVDHQKTAGIGPMWTYSKTVGQKEKQNLKTQIDRTAKKPCKYRVKVTNC